jgi:hypothetical protein
MTDISLESMGNVRFRWYPENGFANYRYPTVAELNAGLELEAVTIWDNFDIGAQASETSEIIPIKAKAVSTRRAAANFGGTASFWYPGVKSDMDNAAALVYSAFKEINTPGFLVTSVDGEIGESGQPSSDFTFANGDYVSVYKVITDEWDDSITGEEAFFYTRNFLKYGALAVYTVAGTGAPVIVSSPDTIAASVGDLDFLSTTLNGRDWTRGVTYSSSDETIVSVSSTGVSKAVSAGTATITATLPGATSSTTDTVSVTVS